MTAARQNVAANNVLKFVKRLEEETIAQHEPCDCVEEYTPLTWNDLCPNCHGRVTPERIVREGRGS